MKAVINFKKGSPHYESGEKQRIVENLTEVHYRYPTAGGLPTSTAFESDIEATGFTVRNEWIEDFEITP